MKRLAIIFLVVVACQSESGMKELCPHTYKGSILKRNCGTVIQLLDGKDFPATSTWFDIGENKQYENVFWVKNDCGLDSTSLAIWLNKGAIVYFNLDDDQNNCATWCSSKLKEPSYGYNLSNVTDQPCRAFIQ